MPYRLREQVLSICKVIDIVRLDRGIARRKNGGFRAMVALDSPYLERDGKQFRVSAGMLASAEVNLGSRTVMEYLLSPVQKVAHETGRER